MNKNEKLIEKIYSIDDNQRELNMIIAGMQNEITLLKSQLNSMNDNFNNTVDQSNFLLSNVFSFSTSDVSAHTSKMTTKINVYSFALKPEEHQPSGTCNFSRIDDARLEFGTASGISATDNIYAVNYNILRIMSGMGGLAYSN